MQELEMIYCSQIQVSSALLMRQLDASAQVIHTLQLCWELQTVSWNRTSH